MAESPSLPELGAVLELSTLAQPTLSARHAGWRLRLSPHEAAPPPDFHFCLSPAPTGEAGCVALRAVNGPPGAAARLVRVRAEAAEVWVDGPGDGGGEAGWAAQASWRLRAPGLAAAPGAVSLESCAFAGFVLRAGADGACVVAQHDGSAAFAGDATFTLARAGAGGRRWHVPAHARMAAPPARPLPAPVLVTAPVAAAPRPPPSPSPVGLHVNVELRAHGQPALIVRHDGGRGQVAARDAAAADSIFEIVEAASGAADAVSLRCFNAPTRYMRVRPEAAEVWLDELDGSATAADQASWRCRPGLADATMLSLQSAAFAGFFLVHVDGLLAIATPHGAESTATFSLKTA